jgi:hypothetical protein
MRTGRFLIIFSILVLGLVVPSAAQRKRRPTPRPTPTPVKLTVSPVVSAAKQQVANQLHNVNVFVDKMGPIAVAIENADKQANARRLKKEDVDANEANKKKLIAAIRGLRDGLVALETDFRTKPQLSQYLSKIQGISSLCARSEDNAIAGRFVASKDPLRQIALKLNETLAVLPGPLAADDRSALDDRPIRSGSNQIRTVSNQTVPVSNQTRSVSNQTRPVVNQPVSNVRRDVSLGMTPSEVLASTWGTPGSKRTSTTQNGTTEVWSYPGNRTVYFFNGKVTRVVP